MAVTVTTLNKRELECADHFLYLLEKMGKLSHHSRWKVYNRWIQFHLIHPQEAALLDAIVGRANGKT